uniref:Uncharacterized protein n=1 Tax=Romanomermis culicivorax TaxID=13658 RepID=A0A915JAR3_ROMCU
MEKKWDNDDDFTLLNHSSRHSKRDYRNRYSEVAEKLASLLRTDGDYTDIFRGSACSNGDSDNVVQAETDDEQPITELRFVPQDKNALETIFQALSECQALHPDEDDSFSDGNDFDESEANNGLEPSDDVAFDEHGQVIYERPSNMRGVASDENNGQDAPGPGTDEEAMEVLPCSAYFDLLYVTSRHALSCFMEVIVNFTASHESYCRRVEDVSTVMAL